MIERACICGSGGRRRPDLRHGNRLGCTSGARQQNLEAHFATRNKRETNPESWTWSGGICGASREGAVGMESPGGGAALGALAKTGQEAY